MRGYKLMLWKAYFDKGYGFTNYAKYIIMLFGISSLNVKWTLIIGIIYLFVCLILGKLMFKYGLVDAEHEVQNRVNPFVKEVRNYTRSSIRGGGTS